MHYLQSNHQAQSSQTENHLAISVQDDQRAVNNLTTLLQLQWAWTFLLHEKTRNDGLVLNWVHRMSAEHKTSADCQLTRARVKYSTHPTGYHGNKQLEMLNW